jgi:hypothetical protein
MIILKPFRLVLIVGIACLAPSAAAAQGVTFPGIRWGEPADSVRARLVAGGFTFQRGIDGGDQLFLRADSAWLRTDLRDGRLIGVVLVDRAPPERVEARYRALADSLRSAMGEPDEAESESYRAQRWVAGFSSLELRMNRTGGLRQVELAWRGPGWYDEMARRGEEAPAPAGYTIVAATPFHRIAIDTTVTPPRGSVDRRGRFRIEYRQPITPMVDGVAQDPIDAVEYEMDVDCAGNRTRLVGRATYLQGRRLSSNRPQGQPWGVPQPDGHYARGRDAICRAARGRA